MVACSRGVGAPLRPRQGGAGEMNRGGRPGAWCVSSFLGPHTGGSKLRSNRYRMLPNLVQPWQLTCVYAHRETPPVTVGMCVVEGGQFELLAQAC